MKYPIEESAFITFSVLKDELIYEKWPNIKLLIVFSLKRKKCNTMNSYTLLD